jgi:hypothetical protein
MDIKKLHLIAHFYAFMLKLLLPPATNSENMLMNRLLHKISLLLFIATIVTSCKENVRTVTIDNRYSIDLPYY